MGKVCSLLVALALVAGCSSAVPDDRVAQIEEPIIGGVAAAAPALNAVGALITILRYPDATAAGGLRIYPGDPFCTGTLIGPTAVLSAKHCVESVGQGDFAFAIGPDARNPTRIIPVLAYETETTISGGFLQKGSDVAVLHLEAPITDIEPFAWTALEPSDVGRRFVGVGYGTQDVAGTSGTRRAGSLTLGGLEGRVFELSFGSFDAFKAQVPNIADLQYIVGDVKTSDGERRAREIFDQRVLLSGYEAFLGNAAGDAQTCHGDSGGPLVRRVDGKNTVFGVVSWGHHSTLGYAFCSYGSIYASFGPATQAFLARALAWVDPCGDLTVQGRCEGDVAVRCAAKSEGPRRTLRTECAELGLTCGPGTDGQVACL